MSKSSERKISKKISKCLISIAKEGIIKLQPSNIPTRFIILCNAGLVTGFSKEEAVKMFSSFGKLTDVVMILGKSYSFVIFESLQELNINSLMKLNGSHCLENGTQPLYFSFVEQVDENWGETKKYKSQDWPKGIILRENFVSEDEESSLLKAIQWNTSSAELKHRRVAHFGFAFNYDRNNVDKHNPLPDKIPEVIEPLLQKLVDTGLVLEEKIPDQLTVNEYSPGQGIPSHIDTHSAFEDGIISVSLGSSVVMEFKHPDGRHVSILLPRRSCLLMSAEARYVWTHGIVPRKNDVVTVESGGLSLVPRGIRTSLTFRKVRMANECDCAFKKYCDSTTSSSTLANNAANIEKTHVFEVYDRIASHFSDTRHKPWPNVKSFLHSLPIGSILIDVGCGNGKYLGLTPSVYSIGCDRSRNLLGVCRDRKFEAVNADCRRTPVRDECADAVICIAVIHHLASESRRLEAINDISRLLIRGGRALIYVWAKEQERGNKKSTYLLQQKGEVKTKNDSPFSESVLPIHENRTDFKHSDLLVPWKLNPKTPSLSKVDESQQAKSESYLRYYHVFQEGELENLCSQIENISILRSFYDQGNWCVELQKNAN